MKFIATIVTLALSACGTVGTDNNGSLQSETQDSKRIICDRAKSSTTSAALPHISRGIFTVAAGKYDALLNFHKRDLDDADVTCSVMPRSENRFTCLVKEKAMFEITARSQNENHENIMNFEKDFTITVTAIADKSAVDFACSVRNNR
jgi:hypothetical protein